jgi:hypothetical protein
MDKVFIVFGDGGEGSGRPTMDCFRTLQAAEKFMEECMAGVYDSAVTWEHECDTPAWYRPKGTEFQTYYIEGLPVH